MEGQSNIEGEPPSCQLHFRSACRKISFAQGSLKFGEVSNSFWEGTRREKIRLKIVVLCFLQVFRNLSYVLEMGIDFSFAIRFWLCSYWVKMW